MITSFVVTLVFAGLCCAVAIPLEGMDNGDDRSIYLIFALPIASLLNAFFVYLLYYAHVRSLYYEFEAVLTSIEDDQNAREVDGKGRTANEVLGIAPVKQVVVREERETVEAGRQTPKLNGSFSGQPTGSNPPTSMLFGRNVHLGFDDVTTPAATPFGSPSNHSLVAPPSAPAMEAEHVSVSPAAREEKDGSAADRDRDKAVLKHRQGGWAQSVVSNLLRHIALPDMRDVNAQGRALLDQWKALRGISELKQPG